MQTRMQGKIDFEAGHCSMHRFLEPYQACAGWLVAGFKLFPFSCFLGCGACRIPMAPMACQTQSLMILQAQTQRARAATRVLQLSRPQALLRRAGPHGCCKVAQLLTLLERYVWLRCASLQRCIHAAAGHWKRSPFKDNNRVQRARPSQHGLLGGIVVCQVVYWHKAAIADLLRVLLRSPLSFARPTEA